MNLYSKNSAGDHQGLLIDEATGRTVALAYDASETAELARRWNAFESGGEVERLRAILEKVTARLCAHTVYETAKYGCDGKLYMEARAALARKAVPVTTTRTQIRLSAEDRAKAETIGAGNVSEGMRIALAAYGKAPASLRMVAEDGTPLGEVKVQA